LQSQIFQTAGYPNRHTNRYFCEVLEPRGILDAAMVTIAREPRLVGYAAFNRHQSAGDIGETEVSGLRLLGPHFRRAVTISNLFDMKAIEASSFASDLTPAETRIFELITTGMTQATIGEALGIAASAVKTHVLHLFEKTGCRRQADLLKLATTLSSPV
jgi:DNA-binding CsgD family transcriptional regulator